jgi:N-acetylglucosamine transport system substrate-binding protein
VLQPIPSEAATERVVEAAFFEGGYGVDWHQSVADAYSEARSQDSIRVTLWGDPRSDEKVKPRLLRGDPPDVILSGGLPFWMLIANDKLHPFDASLDQPAPGSDRPWRDLFVPGTLDTFTSEGHTYAVPSSFGAWSCWYDARQFREHGWEVPKTWSEFTALCEQMKADGVAPLAFQGKYPLYSWWTLVSLIQRCGGVEAINRINALQPDGFTHPDVVWAATLLQEMALNQFQQGAMAMTHTEGQLQFVNNQAAMIFCGLWLENEMKESIGPGFEMRCFNVPAVEGGKGNPALFNGMGGEFLFIPTDANHPELAADFCRYMISPARAAEMASTIGSISPLRGVVPRDAVSPALQSALDMIDNAPGIFNLRVDTLLVEWKNQHILPGLADLLYGNVTPEEFCRFMQDGIDAAVADPDIIKPPFVRIDPAVYGEPAA